MARPHAGRATFLGILALVAFVGGATRFASLQRPPLTAPTMVAPAPVEKASLVLPTAPLSTSRRMAEGAAPLSDTQRAQLVQAAMRAPLAFEQNQGQADAAVKFVARGPGYTVFLTPSEAVLRLKQGPGVRGQGPGKAKARARLRSAPPIPHPPSPIPHDAVLRLRFEDANPAPRLAAEQQLPGTANYFRGRDSARWRAGLPTYAKVRYEDVYPGIDVVFYGDPRRLEHDFVVAPGADPSRIRFRLREADGLRLSPGGDLEVSVGGTGLLLRRPVIYQEDGLGRRTPVEGSYALHHDRDGAGGLPAIGFVVAAHDTERPLVIDPVLDTSTFLGGTDWDEGAAVAVDPDGNVYVAGYTSSLDFPATAGALDTEGDFDWGDAFVVKLAPGGTSLIYATYLGGSGSEGALALAADAAGNAYVAGYTDSIDFPATNGVYQGTLSGGSDAFVAKLGPSGTTLVFSAFLGGTMDDYPWTIAVNADGHVYVAGEAGGDFPTTPSALIPNPQGGGDAFVARLDSTAEHLLFSTFLGGSGYDAALGLALAPDGQVAVAGETASDDFPTTSGAHSRVLGGARDGFIALLYAEGTAAVFSTYLGGTGDDTVAGVAVDTLGYVYAAGTTESSDFPVTPGAYSTAHSGVADVFVAKLHPSGSSLAYSTFIGGDGYDWGVALAVDAAGHAWVTGSTLSTNFPATDGAHDTSYNGEGVYGDGDAFIAVLNTAGTGLISSTFLGGAADDAGTGIAVAGNGQAYLAGYTSSSGFPITANAPYQTHGGGEFDAFLARVGIPAASTFALQVVKTGPGAGAVISNPPGITCGSACSFDFDADLTVTLTATEEPGSTFTGWSGVCTGTDSCTVTMGEAQSVTATFELVPASVALTATKAGSAEGTVSSIPAGVSCGATCSAGFTPGTVVTLSASPAAGAAFREWRGACSGSSPTCILSVNDATTVTAVFSRSFTDDPLVARATPVRAVHVTELRTAIDTLRARRSLAPFAYTDPGLTPGVTPVKAVHLTNLRTALTEAYQAAGRSSPSCAESLTAGQTWIKASHVAELRTLVRGLE